MSRKLVALLAFVVLAGCASGSAESYRVWRGPSDSEKYIRWAQSSPF